MVFESLCMFWLVKYLLNSKEPESKSFRVLNYIEALFQRKYYGSCVETFSAFFKVFTYSIGSIFKKFRP